MARGRWLTDEEQLQIMQLKKSGMSIRGIASKLARSQQLIGRVLKDSHNLRRKVVQLSAHQNHSPGLSHTDVTSLHPSVSTIATSSRLGPSGEGYSFIPRSTESARHISSDARPIDYWTTESSSSPKNFLKVPTRHSIALSKQQQFPSPNFIYPNSLQHEQETSTMELNELVNIEPFFQHLQDELQQMIMQHLFKQHTNLSKQLQKLYQTRFEQVFLKFRADTQLLILEMQTQEYSLRTNNKRKRGNDNPQDDDEIEHNMEHEHERHHNDGNTRGQILQSKQSNVSNTTNEMERHTSHRRKQLRTSTANADKNLFPLE